MTSSIWQIVAQQGSLILPDIGMELEERTYGVYVKSVEPKGRATNVFRFHGDSCRAGYGDIPVGGKLLYVAEGPLRSHTVWHFREQCLLDLFRMLQTRDLGAALIFRVEGSTYTIVLGDSVLYI